MSVRGPGGLSVVRVSKSSYQPADSAAPAPLTPLESRSKSIAIGEPYFCRKLPHDIGPAAALAASPDLPLAADLGAVDPAPGERGSARRRHDPAGVVARRGGGRAGCLCRRPGVSRFVGRPDPAVRPAPRLLLPSVQRAAAPVGRYPPRP